MFPAQAGVSRVSTIVRVRNFKCIYRVTYPNGKIYVGMDLTGDPRYFGSPSRVLLERDFSLDDLLDFTVRKEILWMSTGATDHEVRMKEQELIIANSANNPKIGYNQLPKYVAADEVH